MVNSRTPGPNAYQMHGSIVLPGPTICLIFLLVPLSQANAQLAAGSQNVVGTLYTPQYTYDGKIYGPYSGNYSYAISFDGSRVEKDVQIEFVFRPNITMTTEEQTAWMSNVEAGIEDQWNDRCFLKDNDTGSAYPLLVDVTYEGPFDQTVTVWNDGEGPWTNMFNWHVGDSTLCNSHELGHMLGLYDEYWGGAVNPLPDPRIDEDALMGSITGDPEMPLRYYQQFLDYVLELNPDSNLALIPEPGVLILLIIGGIALINHRRCKRRRKSAAGGWGGIKVRHPQEDFQYQILHSHSNSGEILVCSKLPRPPK